MRIANLRTRILLALYTALARMFSTFTTCLASHRHVPETWPSSWRDGHGSENGFQGDICSPVIEKTRGQFDVVICQDVLEHVMDATSVIDSLCRMMKPRGVIYIQISNKYGMTSK